MDIYVPRGQSERFLRSFKKLLESEADPEPWAEYNSSYRGTLSVVKLEGYGRSFDIIQSSETAADFPLPFFHSSIVINYLTSDRIAMAYPKPTLKYKGILRPSPSPTISPEALAITTYLERGYTLTPWPPHPLVYAPNVGGSDDDPDSSCPDSYTCPREYRTFSDKKALQIPLFRPKLTASHPFYTEWRLGGFGCSSLCANFVEPEAFVFPSVDN